RPDETIPVMVVGHEETEGGRRELLLAASEPLRQDDFGVFDVGPFRETGDLLFGPAMDDLAGCAAILATLDECRRRGLHADVVGLFTRAEEVGLTGATLVARERLLPADALVISLEASRALPGAEMGGGPVIRVGDRSGSFDPGGEALLRRAAQRLADEAGEGPAVAIQRQLMAGGTCEATAFTSFGYAAAGIAFPLGNYHNASPEGVIAPEFIDRRDLETGVRLLVAAIECAGEAAQEDPVRTRLTTRADGLAARLRETKASWRLD
ncbi:MAG TPA: M20/M25/M40 family metallo-hydrolase, partial [Chloroflexota bacterium]|nr:M20/M25/M40 family metallo-hydrolase [Chloroflexota bacterium]